MVKVCAGRVYVYILIENGRIFGQNIGLSIELFKASYVCEDQSHDNAADRHGIHIDNDCRVC